MSADKIISTVPVAQAARDMFGNDPDAVSKFLEAAKELEAHGYISAPIFDVDGLMVVELFIPEEIRR